MATCRPAQVHAQGNVDRPVGGTWLAGRTRERGWRQSRKLGIAPSIRNLAGEVAGQVEIGKSILAPSLPAEGSIGVDFNFRDNDNNNDPNLTTVYTWSDFERLPK